MITNTHIEGCDISASIIRNGTQDSPTIRDGMLDNCYIVGEFIYIQGVPYELRELNKLLGFLRELHKEHSPEEYI